MADEPSYSIIRILLGILLGIAATAAASRLLDRIRRPRDGAQPVERTRVAKLTTVDVITWFRDHADLLRKYPGCVSVLLRSGSGQDSREILSQGMFDQKDNVLRFWREIVADELDGELKNLFGDKDLVVFQ